MSSTIVTVPLIGAGTEADPKRPDISGISPAPAGYRFVEDVDADNVKIEHWGENLAAQAEAATTVEELRAVVNKIVIGST